MTIFQFCCLSVDLHMTLVAVVVVCIFFLALLSNMTIFQFCCLSVDLHMALVAVVPKQDTC